MKGNVIRLNIMHLNSVQMNSIGEVQSVSLKAGESTEDPVYPPTTYTLAANVSNGKVTATKNGTAISLPYVATEGDVIVLSVTPDEGYEFKGWLDGNKSNPRTVTMTGNVVLSASCVEIAKPTYTLSASVTNGKVSATRNGSAVNLPFTANEGDTIVLEVQPNDGYSFEGWADGNTDNPRTITMTADVVLSAECVEVVVPSKYIQFEDAEVERVLMSKGVSSDGVGITIEDAERVTSISTWFKGNTAITSFDEFKNFTGVTSLVASAFEGCSALTSLSVEHIEEINSRSLYGCTALSYDYLNLANLVKLGGNAFYGVKIKKLNLGKVTSLPSADSSTQNYGDKSVLEEVILANGVTKIPQYSFLSYAKVDMDLPSTITEVERHAFQNCSVLGLGKSLSLPNLIVIGLHAFYGTAYERIDNLGNIESITDGISYLAGTFSQNPYLKFVRIPPTCTLVGRNAFASCPALETVIIEAIIPPTGHSEMFLSTNNTFIIYVPDASVEAYKTATNWNQYSDRIKPLSEYVKE